MALPSCETFPGRCPYSGHDIQRRQAAGKRLHGPCGRGPRCVGADAGGRREGPLVGIAPRASPTTEAHGGSSLSGGKLGRHLTRCRGKGCWACSVASGSGSEGDKRRSDCRSCPRRCEPAVGRQAFQAPLGRRAAAAGGGREEQALGAGVLLGAENNGLEPFRGGGHSGL